jgi:hypothetical protein
MYWRKLNKHAIWGHAIVTRSQDITLCMLRGSQSHYKQYAVEEHTSQSEVWFISKARNVIFAVNTAEVKQVFQSALVSFC